MNLLILISAFLLILISLIGYGYIFVKLFCKETIDINFGYLGVFGLIFSIFISYSSNFFLPHNYFFNSIYLLVGLLGIIILFKQNSLIHIKKEFLIFLTVSFVALLSLLIFKNHDDFSYYHFVYTYNLTQFDLNIGTGQFNHGFRTPSSIFYINSLFYLPFIKYHSFNFAAVIILIFSNIILLKKVGIIYSNNFFSFKKKIDNKNILVFFSLLSFIFINIFFYRIGEHGTDRSAQILVMLLIIEIIESFNRKSYDNFLNLKIFTLLIFIISLKAFYILYLILLLPLYLNYYKYFKSNFYLLKNLLSGYLIFYVLIFLLILSSYFFSTGCLLYPIEITCFDTLGWSIPGNQVEQMNQWYQQWSKAGAGPGFRVDDPQVYIEKFNWLSNWIDKYFFNKVSDFLFGIIFLAIVIIISFRKSNKSKTIFKIQKNYIFLYGIILILFFEWFYNHPALRYGGYNLIAIIIFLPISVYLSSKNIKFNNYKFTSSVLIILTVIIFSGRNMHRIYKEHVLYGYNPLIKPFYKVNESYFREYTNLKNLIYDYNKCVQNNNCQEIKVKEKYGIYIFEN